MERLELVVKIGSMALIQKEENAIDYNIFQRLGGDLRPGMILVINDGQIVEAGTHEGLLEKQGFYYRLYTSQYAV